MCLGSITAFFLGCGIKHHVETRQRVLTQSLDVRGRRPSIDELSVVAKNERSLNRLLDELLKIQMSVNSMPV